MSRDDPSRRQASRAELDQRSRAARLRLDDLQRLLAKRSPARTSRLTLIIRLLGLGGHGRRHRAGRIRTAGEAEGQRLGTAPGAARPSWPAAASARCDWRAAFLVGSNVLPMPRRRARDK